MFQYFYYLETRSFLKNYYKFNSDIKNMIYSTLLKIFIEDSPYIKCYLMLALT